MPATVRLTESRAGADPALERVRVRDAIGEAPPQPREQVQVGHAVTRSPAACDGATRSRERSATGCPATTAQACA